MRVRSLQYVIVIKFLYSQFIDFVLFGRLISIRGLFYAKIFFFIFFYFLHFVLIKVLHLCNKTIKTNKMNLIPLTGKAAKKSQKKFANREAYSNVKANANASAWLAEKNRENALNNLPSSLR